MALLALFVNTTRELVVSQLAPVRALESSEAQGFPFLASVSLTKNFGVKRLQTLRAV